MPQLTTPTSARLHRPPGASPAQSPRGRLLPELRSPGAAVAAALVLPPLLFFAPGARADVFVQNVNQTADTNALIFESPKEGYAQQFTTGSSSFGYTLESIGVVFETVPSATQLASLSGSLWSSFESGGLNNNPDSHLHALTAPTSITAGEVALFTAPKGTTLAANTSYFVAITGAADGVRLGATATGGEDTGARPGWSIHNTGHVRLRVSDTQLVWEGTNDDREMRIQVRGPDGPEPVSATVAGRWVEITFDEDLDETSTPSNGDFDWQTYTTTNPGVIPPSWGSSPAGFSGQIYVVGRTVTLTSIGAIGSTTDPMRLSYTGRGIRDRAGNSAPGFRVALTNLTNADGPGLLQAEIDGTEVRLFFDRELQTNYVPAPSRFDVRHEGNPVEVTATAVPRSRTVTLTLARGAVYGDSAWSVSYDATTDSGEQIRAHGGNARSFTGRVLKTLTAPAEAPRLLRALWYDSGGIELRYDQTLTPSAGWKRGPPPASAYTVTVNGDTKSVSEVSIGQASVGLDVSTSDLADAAPCSVVVTYRVPANHPVTGLAGGRPAAAIDAQTAARVNRDGSFDSCGTARPLVSASDASATEGVDTTADFVVSLYPAATPLHLDWSWMSVDGERA